MKTGGSSTKAYRNISHGRRFAAMCAAMAAAVCAFADVDPYEGYVRLNGADTGTGNSYSFNKRGNWADKAAPSAEKNYYVPSGALLWQTSANSTSEADRTWQGGQLVIGDGGLFHTSVNNAAAYGPLVKDLVLLGGSECRVLCFAFLGIINNVTSAVTVVSTPEKPAVISHHHKDSGNGSRNWAIQARFTGTADSTLVLTRPFNDYTNGVIDTVGWWCLFSRYQFAEYPGTVIMRGGNFKAMSYEDRFSFIMPQATLRVEQGATCKFNRRDTYVVSADAQIGALDCEGGVLQFNCVQSGGDMIPNPVLNVSKRFSIDDTSSVNILSNVTAFLVGVSPDNPCGISHSLVHLTGTAATTLGDISGAKVDALYSELYGYPLSLYPIDNGDGTKDIFIATPNTVVMTNVNSSTSSALGAFDAGRGGDWTNLKEPDADSALTYMNLKTLTFHDANYEYTNATLAVAATMYNIGAAQCKFKTVNFCKGGSFRSWGTANPDRMLTAERINVFAQSFRIDTSTSVKMTLDGDLYGDGDLMIGNYDNAYSWVHLTHLNTNYHGRITLQSVTKSGEELKPNRFSSNLADARNWGGEYTGDGDGHDAITLKDFPVVLVTDNVTFSEPTRGILVQNGATFNVASGKTLTLSNRVTFAGMLTKNNSGILDLAGAARFLDGGENTAPLATTNVLLVSKGRLRISSKAAADGLEVHFAQGTRLIIPADTEAGYFNVKWDEPLVIETTDGKLPVEIDPAGVQGDRMLTVPICTFGATAAANISPEVFSVTMAVDGMRLRSVAAVQNGDGTVSYCATFGPVGCRIILR